jgi:mannose-6-phosphate isomerase-like protein (cupin superfamily)
MSGRMLDVVERRDGAIETVTELFARDGFVGPLPLLEPHQCGALVNWLTGPQAPAPAVWLKGGAVTDWRLSKLGAHPRLMAMLKPILGRDIILWGAKLIVRKPGQVHLWHVDAETSAPGGRYVTAWIGLHNTSGDSGIRMIAGSHRCRRTLEQFQADEDRSRNETSNEDALAWAKSENPGAWLAEPEAANGDVILFDGRMWHGSHNRLSDKTRYALLLQFAAAESPVRILSQGEERRAPSILVHGQAISSTNWLVPPAPPPAKRRERLASEVHQLTLPLPENPEAGWQRYPLFLGSTPVLASLSCHAAVLSPGHSPHPPHAHQDEELLLVLAGEADLLTADRPSYEDATAVRVKAGDFAYYHALQHHTIRNASRAPVTYLMFRWHGRIPSVGGKPLRSHIFRSPPEAPVEGGRPFTTRALFGARTRWLGRLHCHTSRVEAGGGYAVHTDPYDVAMVILSGRVETLGREVGSGGVIFYPKGERHGLRNVGDQAARYIVFEFHPPQKQSQSLLGGSVRGCVLPPP